MFPSLISEGSIEASRVEWDLVQRGLFPSLISEGSIEAREYGGLQKIARPFPSLISEGSIEACDCLAPYTRRSRFPR